MVGSVNLPMAGIVQCWVAALSAVSTGQGFRIRQVIILCLLSAQKTSLLEIENPDVCRKALHPILNEVASS